MLTGIVLSIALSTASVPPGGEVANHAHPGHYTQPTIRRFERRLEDNARRNCWEKYCKDLEQLWRDYRDSGSTHEAWRTYNSAAAELKRRYVYEDPYYLPVLP